MRPIGSLRLPSLISDRAELCVLGGKACHKALQICTYPNQRNGSIFITLHPRARILPTCRYRVDNQLIQSP